MHRDRQWLNLSWKGLLASGLLVALMISISATATVAQSRRYSPPRGGTPPRSSGIGGARSGSCTGETATPFTALAPQSQVGQTAAAHPTFAWYVPDSHPLTIDFRLYVYRADGRLQPQPLYQTELSSTPGIMQFTLPETEPPLEVGEHYYWQAALLCDPNHGSEDLIISAEIQRVVDTVPVSERWYDLLPQALDSTPPQPQAVGELLQELASEERTAGEQWMQSADAAAAADRPPLLRRSQDTLQHSQQLMQIVEAL